MNTVSFCQSCTMPLDTEELLGTEKDGSKNHEYCKYCYQDGAFTDPAMTLSRMQTTAVNEMKKQGIDAGIIDAAVQLLPTLKRWRADKPAL